MNKIKNFLYDISDLFLSLLIISIIFVVVSVKLTDTMADTWFMSINSEEYTEVEYSEATIPDESVLPPDDPTETEVETPVVEEVESPEEPVDVIEVIEVKDVKFTVAPGSTGYRIAKSLKEETLIDDVDVFLQTLEELDLGSKLRAGDFKLDTGMTTEEIIKVLAGQ